MVCPALLVPMAVVYVGLVFNPKSLLCRLGMLQYLFDPLLCSVGFSGGLQVVRVARCCRVFLHAAGSCGLGTDLPSISAVVVHDSDWDPRADLQVPSPHYLTDSPSCSCCGA